MKTKRRAVWDTLRTVPVDKKNPGSPYKGDRYKCSKCDYKAPEHNQVVRHYKREHE